MATFGFHGKEIISKIQTDVSQICIYQSRVLLINLLTNLVASKITTFEISCYLHVQIKDQVHVFRTLKIFEDGKNVES